MSSQEALDYGVIDSIIGINKNEPVVNKYRKKKHFKKPASK